MAIKISKSARRFSGAGIVMAAVVASLIAAPPADAGGTTPVAPAGNSCSLDLGTGALTCVPDGQDLNAAVLKQQGLRVVAPAAARGVTPAASPAGADTTYVLSQLYDDINYGGSFFQITGSAACNGSTVYYVSNLSSYGWSGRVSSFKSFSACTTKVWQGNNETGAAYGYNVNAASLGAMNDQVTMSTRMTTGRTA